MTATIYYILCGILSLLALVGISMMSKVKTSVRGNLLLSFCMLAGIVVTLLYYQIFEVVTIYALIIIGSIIGAYMARKLQMMQMPQAVAMLNGLGGLAGGIVGALTFIHIGVKESDFPTFVNVTAILAVVVGMVTFVGSMVAAGKLHRILGQKPVVWKNHSLILSLSMIGSLASIAFGFIVGQDFGIISDPYFILALGIVSGCVFGLAFSIRVGGADMPITISLLTSLAGIAAAIAGLAIGDLLVVSIGGIVGSSGLVLTQIMCRAMNRSLMAILTGKTSVSAAGAAKAKPTQSKATAPAKVEKKEEKSLASIIKNTKRAIIVPGYGMALAQAQHQVRQLADMLEAQGTDVKYAIHPVAGRMPGHMNVLLAEADVPYDKLYEMDNINDDFKDTDLVVVIGANDVLNPAARDAAGTPIYGMPVLNVDQAKNIVICNYDLNPGYAGVPNPLYEMTDKVTLLLGDAKESLNKLMHEANKSDSVETKSEGSDLSKIIKNTKRAIIVPGYGMALAQAQHQVRQLADMLEAQGADVKYAIHPVAGRMPGHMNVLLAEADVPYDKLYEMDNINDDFKDTDLVVVIGANDVLNPAARDAEGTPIYGMPVLNVDQAKNIVICNYDLNPGYAGVPNPLYEMTDKVTLLLGDAKESLNKLMQEANKSESDLAEPKSEGPSLSKIIKNTKRAIIVPGYGMALAQAQHQVRQLADMLEAQGADVKYAIHPVAGRMPGHMNVLLAEADVSYDKLYEMDNINDDFKDSDLVVVIGANDVLNPAARDAEGTPIYGMPVLNVDQAKNIVICNYDLNPGYAGVPNPLYEMTDKVTLLLGDAKESLNKLMREASKTEEEKETPKEAGADLDNVLKTAKRVIIVPGYGMALAQAQHQVRQLADLFEAKGADVKYAIHPVAGRMPGHMNVLLAEADVSYDRLYEMDNINDDFKDTDLVVVIGANDVLNPAARDAEGTPIYGMPVLNVDEAKCIVICNYDLNPGYAGVPNPLYEMTDKVTLLLGDAKESLSKLIKKL